MAVYKPKRKGDSSKFYVCEFIYQGKRFQESTGTTSKTVAKEYEKRRKAELERAAAGLPTEQKANRIKTVSDVLNAYQKDYAVGHRESSREYVEKRLRHVERVLGTALLSDLTEERVHAFIRQRKAEGAAGRTVNMELGELSRAIGQPWSLLWPKVRKQEEKKDTGRAITPEEQGRLLDAAAELRSPIARAAIPMLMLTGFRVGEALSLQWQQVDFLAEALTVGKAKTSSGTGRVVPMNADLLGLLTAHREWFVRKFGEAEPNHYVFPYGSPQPTDPTKPVLDMTSSWDKVREAAGVKCRLHDLRHTFCTRLAEAGVPESTMLALMGHMSRAMLERYSHIRMAAKREAVAAVTLRPRCKAESSEGLVVTAPMVDARATVH